MGFCTEIGTSNKLVTILSQVEVAMGKAVRMELRE
jgi:hypothetical protein